MEAEKAVIRSAEEPPGPSWSGSLGILLSVGVVGLGGGGGDIGSLGGLRMVKIFVFRRSCSSALRGGERRLSVVGSSFLQPAYSMKVRFSFSTRSMKWIGLGFWRHLQHFGRARILRHFLGRSRCLLVEETIRISELR